MVAAQDPPQRVFSTLDHTTTVGSPMGLREAWVDVKAPGNERIYNVGTIEVVDTDPQNNPTFSNEIVLGAGSPAPVFTVGTASRS